MVIQGVIQRIPSQKWEERRARYNLWAELIHLVLLQNQNDLKTRRGGCEEEIRSEVFQGIERGAKEDQ